MRTFLKSSHRTNYGRPCCHSCCCRGVPVALQVPSERHVPDYSLNKLGRASLPSHTMKNTDVSTSVSWTTAPSVLPRTRARPHSEGWKVKSIAMPNVVSRQKSDVLLRRAPSAKINTNQTFSLGFDPLVILLHCSRLAENDTNAGRRLPTKLAAFAVCFNARYKMPYEGVHSGGESSMPPCITNSTSGPCSTYFRHYHIPPHTITLLSAEHS